MRNELKIGRYADILMDRWFKRTFGTEQAIPLLTLMLETLIPERKIAHLRLSPQEHVNEYDDNKDIRVDIECTDKDGTRFMVEMQLSKHANFYERAIFNSSFGIQEQIPYGFGEYDYPPLYFIGIMNFSIHKNSDKVLYRYTLQERDSHELMSDRLQYIFLELPNCENVVKGKATEVDKFSDALRNMPKWDERPAGYDSELIKLLLKSAEIANFAPEIRKKYIHDMTTAQDIVNQIAYARKEGREEGIKKGMEKGRVEERKANAKALLAAGVPAETVAYALGIQLDELKAL